MEIVAGYFWITLVYLTCSCTASAASKLSFLTTQVVVEENNVHEIELKVQRKNGLVGDVTFHCKIMNITSDDFAAKESSGTFKNGGKDVESCSFYMNDDEIPEGNETFVVQLSLLGNTGTLEEPSIALIKILANDGVYGSFGFNTQSHVVFHEPKTNATNPKKLLIQRNIGTYGDVTVGWKVSPSTSGDITPTSGVVLFQDGDHEKNLEFHIITEKITESLEQFVFELTSISKGGTLNSTTSKLTVIISANDIPLRFALNDISAAENQSQITLWVYRGLDMTGTINEAPVDNLVTNASWYLQSGTAIADSDFDHSNGTLVFNGGETKKSITVTILEDTIPERTENFTIHLTTSSPHTTIFEPSICTIRILPNDDHAGVFQFSGDTTVIASEDGTMAQLTIQRDAGSYGDVTVAWRVISNVTDQLLQTHGIVNFRDGVKQKQFNISAKQDDIPEEASVFVVELQSVSGGRLTNQPDNRRRMVIVQDSDDVYGAFMFAGNTEQQLTLTNTVRLVSFVINRHGGSLGKVRVSYNISYMSSDGVENTASLKLNTSTSASVTMVPGQRRSLATFSIALDGFVQANSVFRIEITSVKLLTPAQHLIQPLSPRIVSENSTLNLAVPSQYANGEIGFARTSISVPENDSTKTITIQVVRAGTLNTANVTWSMNNNTPSNDITPNNGSITFNKGVDSALIFLHIINDDIPELDETFTITLHNPTDPNHRLQPGSSELHLTILSNDNPGGYFQFVNVESLVYNESDMFQVDVVRVGGDLDTRAVKIEIMNGENDIAPSELALLFKKGEKRKSQMFFVMDDNIPEINETITLGLTKATSFPASMQGTLGNLTQLTVTILSNDDPHGIITLKNASISIGESTDSSISCAKFLLERSRGLFGDVTVTWDVPTVNASLDISETSGQTVLKDGQQYQSIDICSLPDKIPENKEVFRLQLTSVDGGAQLGRPITSDLIILQNDDAVEFAAPVHAIVTEGSLATFTIVRRARTDEAIYVNYTTMDGTAVASDLDYMPLNEQVFFARGISQQSISVKILDDDKPEPNETFTIVLTGSSGDTVVYGDTVAMVTIAASDDPNGVFHFDEKTSLNRTADEGKTVSFRVVRDRGVFGVAKVVWQIYEIFKNGSRRALIADDFQETSGELVFNNLDQFKLLDLTLLSDKLAEYGEDFEVVLQNVKGGGKLSNSFTTAFIHIPTNDHPYGLFAFSVHSMNTSVAEDTEIGSRYKAIANITVVRKRGSDRDVAVSWCIYRLEDSTKLGEIWDLIFLSQKVGNALLENRTRRPNSGTTSLTFIGQKDSYAVVKSLGKVPESGFTLSIWLIPTAGKLGTILAKTASYNIVLNSLNAADVKMTFEMNTMSGRTVQAQASINSTILDGSWHNVMVTVHNETGIAFYYDGDMITENRTATFSAIFDDEGDLYLGISDAKTNPFDGTLQDVIIFSKALEASDVAAIGKPVEDISLVNGYLNYAASVKTHVVSLTTIDNKKPEDEKIFSIILTTSKGGANIDRESQSRTQLIVSKSDNANGIFQFNDDRPRFKTVSENIGNITIEVVRLLAYHGQVTIHWEIRNMTGFKANTEFMNAAGDLIFDDNERTKNLSIEVVNDLKPELLQSFTVHLLSAKSNDGKRESTPRSGASINDVISTFNITIAQNDYPYGLMQLSGSPPQDANIVMLSDVFKWSVRESIGVLKLYIVRAQGTLGDIQCSWKTVTKTAVPDVDYEPSAGTVSFTAGQKSADIAIKILDNEKPELGKTFGVELYDAKNGAVVGVAGKGVIDILPSDDAFGVFNFTAESLLKTVREGDSLNLTVQRYGGALGSTIITLEAITNDLMKHKGEVYMEADQRTADISLRANDDNVPELTEVILVELVNVTNGRLAPTGVVSQITVVANDDPYGVFEFDPVISLVNEADTNITLTVVRRRGTMGKIRVHYQTVPDTVSIEGLGTTRANESDDFRAVNGYIDFDVNQTTAHVHISIFDDAIPEGNETVLVNLTSAILMTSSEKVENSPRIGSDGLAKVVILQNDNASGIISLSSSALVVFENGNGTFINVVRTGAAFGNVVVDFEVIPKEAKNGVDYVVKRNHVLLKDGETSVVLPILVVDDSQPEYNESFLVRLLPSAPDVLLGSPLECMVTIAESDYPYGFIGFSITSLTQVVTEPSSGQEVLNFTITRQFGTAGFVRLQWNVTLHGRLAINDVKVTEGRSFLAPGENETEFSIVILSDNVPEIDEVLLVTLDVIEGQAEINPARGVAVVTVQLNDQAYGVVEFTQDAFVAEEEDHNETICVPILRNRGTYGDLRVYYSTIQQSQLSAAAPYTDYFPVTNATVTIPSGVNTSKVRVVITGDTLPELNEYFTIKLVAVELVNTTTNTKLQPMIGSQAETNVTIKDNDNVYGLFKIFGQHGQSVVIVNETEGLAINLDILRNGGQMGDVQVEVIISSKSTATEKADFIGSGGIVLFKNGDKDKQVVMTIKDDVIPEVDETVIIELVNPTGGASISEGTGNNVTVVIQANDVVAGRLGFSRLSQAVIVKEGELVSLKVERSLPAAGVVNVNWEIEGAMAEHDFNQTKGSLHFEEGENVSYISFMVKADNISEVAEVFHVVLRNPVTTLIALTGAAQVDNITGISTITITSSNQPHGMVQFQVSSRHVSVQEEQSIVELSVVRLFGNIGDIRVYFTLFNNSLQPLNSQQRLASIGDDFYTNGTSIIIRDGSSIGVIRVGITNDMIAELDELFYINLTSVEMVNSTGLTNETFSPPQLGTYTTCEVTITKNDGPYGIMVFDPARVEVPENITAFNLTVLRMQGTFGVVQVNYYIRKVNIQENDFSVVHNDLIKGGEETLVFQEGQRTQNITVFIYDDIEPEGDEVFEVYLKQPRGGAELGTDRMVVVTILVSDAGNGLFRFSTDTIRVLVDEPGSKHVGTTKGIFNVVRENGTIGEVVLGWSITNQTATRDFLSTNGTVVFKDGQTLGSFMVETVVDQVPEKEESFVVKLTVLAGGGSLIYPNEALVIVSENEEPYGEFSFTVAPNTLSVEEDIGSAEVRVSRNKGTYGRVTVNYHTTAQSADGSSGMVMMYGDYQTLPVTGAQSWYTFSAYGHQYLLIGSSKPHSALYRWQGIYILVKELQTNNAVDWVSFEINHQQYMAVANQGYNTKHEVDSVVYKLYSNGSVELYQNIPTAYVTAVTFFIDQQSNERYLIFSNMRSDSGNTDIRSKVYQWSNGRFIEHGNGLNCRGASGLAQFTINGRQFLAISSLFDSVNNNYRGKSVIFEWKNNDFQLIQELQTYGANDVEYSMIDNHHLLTFVNTESSPEIFRWDSGSFILFKTLSLSMVKTMKYFTMKNGVYASVTFGSKTPQMLKWNYTTKILDFSANITAASDNNIQPIIIEDAVVNGVTLLAVVVENTTRLLHPVMVSPKADFIPRSGQLIFENDVDELSFFVTIFNDSASEPDETFRISLNNATGGAVIGSGRDLTVKILSNGNPYGRIEFAPQSLHVRTDEISRDTKVHLEVLRRQGIYGEVIVAWNSTGNATGSHSNADVTPKSGTVVFGEGDTKASIELTIHADDIPELNEVVFVRLTRLIQNGSNLPGKGADINDAMNTAVVTIVANDEPHGVLGWRRTVAIAQESEAINSTVQLVLERQMGTIGDIEVSYSTVVATSNSSTNEKPAIPYQDFIPITDTVVMTEGQNSTNIQIHVVHDDNAEVNEIFFVNITSVRLRTSNSLSTRSSSPRINPEHRIAKIVISENDNKRGVLNFNITHLVDPQSGIIRVNEDIGVLVVPVVRTGGTFGTVGFQYRLVSRTENKHDYFPNEGKIVFAPNETIKFLEVNVTDDNEAEVAEYFRIEMTQPIGGAKLGRNREVSVEIRASDQPYGVFEFVGSTIRNIAEGEEIRLTVQRLQGTFKKVNVFWNLSTDAYPDVIPADGTLGFDNGVTNQSIFLRARDDRIPEGDKVYKCRLWSADNGGVIGGINTVVLNIDANDDGHGVMAVDPQTTLVYVGEPQLPSYNGQVTMTIVRNVATFGKVAVDWDLTSEIPGLANPNQTFTAIKGTLDFDEGVKQRNITLQVKQDSIPEESTKFIFSLTGAYKARIDSSSMKASVIVVASDNPYGIVEFLGQTSYNITEEYGLLTLHLVRHRGNIGELQISVTIVTNGATEKDDFIVSPEVLTIADNKDEAFLNVTIKNDKVAEIAESFTIKLASIKLDSSKVVDYGYKNGLQVDQPPLVGNQSEVMVTILPNDDPHGVVTFTQSKMIVHEDEVATLLVKRQHGVFGKILVTYMVYNKSAQYGLDYNATGGQLVFDEGQNEAEIKIQLFDDDIPEDREMFVVTLTSVNGGAKLGDLTSMEVIIETSDNPDGLFRFEGQLYYVLDNPTASRILHMNVSRKGGARSTVQVDLSSIMIYPTTDTNTGRDIKVEPPVMTFNKNDYGPITIKIIILPALTDEEVEERFKVSIANVSNGASIDEVRSKVTVVVSKRGTPNGVFGFDQNSIKMVREDTGTVIFTIQRQKGTEGLVQVSWRISGSSGNIVNDFTTVQGVVTFQPGETSKQLTIEVVDDTIPELDEVFTLELTNITGGGDINQQSKKATITIKANDDPHGLFSVVSSTPYVMVNGDLTRMIEFTIERSGGAYGDIRVDYSIRYSKNYPSSLNGQITINNGVYKAKRSIVLDENAFLYINSYFSLTLTNVVYQGTGESAESAEIIQDLSTINITVPRNAANSVVRFKDAKLNVNQDNKVQRAVITRDGIYGNVTVFVTAGFPRDRYPGFYAGSVQPSTNQVTFVGDETEQEISIQVNPSDQPTRSLIYGVYLSGSTTPSNVNGGSTIDEGSNAVTIETGGVVVIATSMKDINVAENGNKATIIVYRLYSTLGTIRVKYSTTALSKTSPNVDYKELSSELTMKPGEYRKEIVVKIVDDNIPELDETFRVQITSANGDDVRLGMNTASKVTIKDNDHAHGVLSFHHTSFTVYENTTLLTITVTRSAGTYGNIGAQIRTVGGGENWNIDSTTINEILSKRNKKKEAKAGIDYKMLDTRVNFLNQVPIPTGGQTETVQLEIKNDNIPELDEEIFLYLSNASGGAIVDADESWAVVTIKGNDLYNGKISFTTRSLTLDEDKGTTGEIIVTRTESLGTAKVKWEVVSSEDELTESSGILIFPPNEATTKLQIRLKQDKKPELQSSLTIKLVSLFETEEAVIDSTKDTVLVQIQPSDDPYGLIGFNKETMNVAVDISAKTVSLKVVREQGVNGLVGVSYKTTPLSERYKDGELVINEAVEGEDYTSVMDNLVFPNEGAVNQDILIRLTPSTASSVSYPKAFNVILYNISGGARLNEEFSKSMIIITDTRLTNQFLQLRADSLKTPLSDSEMTRVMNSLLDLITSQTLSGSQVSIVTEVLNNILEDLANRVEENKRILSVDLSNQFMSVFDNLLNPTRKDTSGKSQLTEPMVNYAYALAHGEPCPSTAVIKKAGKYAMIEGRRRSKDGINGLILKSSVDKNTFTYPSNIYETSTTVTAVKNGSTECGDVHFIEYLTDHWFGKDDNDIILNNRVLSTSVKNKAATSSNHGPSKFRIYAEGRVTAHKAECLKWRTGAWDNSICALKEETEEYVECECEHFSNFAVRAQSDQRVGYEFYFYIAAFICMISFFLVVLSHHLCSLENTFTSKLIMHMFFAGFALHLLVVVAAYVSPQLVNKPTECGALGILIHYFLLAQFSWIFVQCCNLWRILVLNDENTDRKFVLYFMLGWGLPLVFVALYVIITHALYSWDFNEIYGDVHNNGDMCFVRNVYGALASILGPVLLFLLSVGVVGTQAYQVTIQWKLYDDIFRGHHNIREVFHLWVVFAGITLTWLFGGLHLAFGTLWLAIVFAIIQACTGLYVFVIYFILRNQCRGKYRDQDYLLNASSPSMLNRSNNDYLAERPVMYDAQSMQSLPKSELRLSPPRGAEWIDDEFDGTTPKGSRRIVNNDHIMAEINPLYQEYHGNKAEEANEDKDDEESSQAFSDLIFALKTGERSADDERGINIAVRDDIPKLELRRMSIADTHV